MAAPMAAAIDVHVPPSRRRPLADLVDHERLRVHRRRTLRVAALGVIVALVAITGVAMRPHPVRRATKISGSTTSRAAWWG
jgi:hypothetical protein